MGSGERTSAAIRLSIAAPPATAFLPGLHLHLLLLLFLGHFCHPLLFLSIYTSGRSPWECDRDARSPASTGRAIMFGGGDCDHEADVGQGDPNASWGAYAVARHRKGDTRSLQPDGSCAGGGSHEGQAEAESDQDVPVGGRCDGRSESLGSCRCFTARRADDGRRADLSTTPRPSARHSGGAMPRS